MNRSERATIRKLVTELCANYDSQDKICLPLDSPCYMLNKWWTGAYCRYFEKAVLPVDAALESAITGEDTSRSCEFHRNSVSVHRLQKRW